MTTNSLRRSFFISGACLALSASSLALAVPSSAARNSRVSVSSAKVIPSGSKSAPLVGTVQLHVSVALQSAAPGALSAMATSVSDPRSGDYRHFLTHEQFVSQYGASDATVQAVKAYVKAYGLGNVTLSGDHLALSATGTAAQIEAAFATNLRTFSVNGVTHETNITPASVPSYLGGAVVSVTGLSDLAVAKSNVSYASHAHAVRAPVSCRDVRINQALSQGSLTVDDIANAYHFSYPGLGSQKRIALYELSSAPNSDMNAFDHCYGIAPHHRVVEVDGGTTDNSGAIEVLLDEEIASAVSPASMIDLYTGPNSDSGWIDTYRAIAEANTASVVSVSWGSCEAIAGPELLDTENTIFQEMAVQGQSVFVASGDSGAQGCQRMNNDTSAQATDPGAQPFVTSVGGTTLVDPVCTRPSASCEVVWNSGGAAGSGGQSSYFAAPSYQRGLGVSAREFPDIAADADPSTGYLIYDKADFYGSYSAWGVIGGTSASAPLEAAFLADTLSACSQRVGLINPLLYSANGTSAFRDITVGSNDTTYTHYNTYNASPGFDMASGLGSIDWSKFGPLVCH